MNGETPNVREQGAHVSAREKPSRNLMILGRNGMLRDALVRRALAEGHQVSVTVFSKAEAEMYEQPRVTTFLAGEADGSGLPQSAPKGYDAIVDVTTPEYLSDEPQVEKYAEALLGHKSRVSQWAAQSDAGRLVFVDQAALFAAGTDGIALAREDHALADRGYGRAYRLVWNDYRDICAHHGRVVRLHPGEMYGPGGWLQHKIVEPLKYTGQIRVIGKGDNRIPPLYVDDAASGILLAAEQGETGGDYILGAPDVAFETFLEMTTGLMGLALRKKTASFWWEKTRRGVMPTEHKALSYTTDDQKARQALGWSPVYDNLQQGIALALKSLGVLAWK